MTNFSIKENTLILDINDTPKGYKLPHKKEDLENVNSFVKDLNRRVAKLDITHKDVTTDDNYVYITKDIKVLFPRLKQKHIKVDHETHALAKMGAARANMSLQDYTKYCLLMCKSDVKAMK